MKRTLVFGLAVTLLAACSTQEIDTRTPVPDDVMFYASFEQPGDEATKVYANEDLLLRWTADDRVSIFNQTTYNQQYQFVGETGDNAGGFMKVDTYEFVTGNDITDIVSVYPYQASTKISESELVTVNLPAEQFYAENTFGLGANTMVSVSDDNFLQYKNVGGYLVLKLYGEGVSVSSIKLKGNNDEKLAGKASVTMPLDGLPSVEMASNATTEIILTCATPVQLGATEDNSTQFWFVVPPATFSKGFTIIVNDSFGGTFEKQTSKSIAIERNNLSKMSPIEVVPVFHYQKYLTFTSEGTTTVSLTNNGNNAPVVYYSMDKTNWTPWDYSELTFSSEHPLYLCGNNPDGFSCNSDQYSVFTASGSSFGVSGDIMSLINSEHDLTAVPSQHCFRKLFNNCTGLTSAPELPATTLTDNCYAGMFNGCTSLTIVPALPATTLASSCYNGMFGGCTSLTTAPDLPATMLASYCYSGMFNGCTSLTTAPELPATTLADRCYPGMFYGCTSLTTAPALPATTLADNCYDSMFRGCTSLTAAPELPAATLADHCYWCIFYGCSKINYIKCLAKDIRAEGCLNNWLDGVAATGTFVKASGMNDWTYGTGGIPEGWTVIDYTYVPEAVDMGLSVKWASFNLGASKPEE